MPSSITVAERDRYTVPGIIRRLGSEQPGAEMLVEGTQRRTWGEELDTACRVAQAARRDGLGAGARIAFFDRNGIAYFDVLFGGCPDRCGQRGRELAALPGRDGRHHRRLGCTTCCASMPSICPHWPTCPSGLPAVRRIVVLGGADSLGDARVP